MKPGPELPLGRGLARATESRPGPARRQGLKALTARALFGHCPVTARSPFGHYLGHYLGTIQSVAIRTVQHSGY